MKYFINLLTVGSQFGAELLPLKNLKRNEQNVTLLVILDISLGINVKF